MRIRLLDLLMPPRCGGCQTVGSWLCSICRGRIRRLNEPLCRRCGAEVESARNDCGCRSRLKALTRLRSAVAYEGPVEHAVHRFKYQGWKRLAEPLALLLAQPPGKLVRTRPTPPQVGHDRRWRLENVRDAFEWQGFGLESRSILLIDD